MGRKAKPAEVRARFFTARATGATLKGAAVAGVSKTTGHSWLVCSSAGCGRGSGARVRRRGCRWTSWTPSCVAWPSAGRARRSRPIWAGRCRRSRGRWPATAGQGVPGGARGPARGRPGGSSTGGGKLAGHQVLRAHVEEKLKRYWSPQQIGCRLEVEFADDPAMRVSHETIHTALFVQTTAVLRTELTGQLRTQRGPAPSGSPNERRPGRRTDPGHDADRRPPRAHVGPPRAWHWEGEPLGRPVGA
jgi:hypothetical protein